LTLVAQTLSPKAAGFFYLIQVEMNLNLFGSTRFVADTADLDQLKSFRTQDVTTNPSLVLKALLKLED